MTVMIHLDALLAWIFALVTSSIAVAFIDVIFGTRPASDNSWARTAHYVFLYAIGGILTILFLRVIGINICQIGG